MAHEIALVVNDSLKNAWEEHGVETYIQCIKSGRELAKKLRQQNNVLLLTAKGKNRPPLDVQTRYVNCCKINLAMPC